jgi:hypothetical protein
LHCNQEQKKAGIEVKNLTLSVGAEVLVFAQVQDFVGDFAGEVQTALKEDPG